MVAAFSSPLVCSNSYVLLLFLHFLFFLSFVSNVTSKKGKKEEDSDDSDSDVDNLDDEEVSLGSMDEEDFGDELEEDGGTFVDPEGGGEEEDDDDEGKEHQKCVQIILKLIYSPVPVHKLVSNLNIFLF